LAAIALGQFIEERYNVTIDPHEVNADNFGSLNQVANFIRAKQNSAAA
jgi:acyl carrier protein